MKYQEFLKTKKNHVKPVGFDVDIKDINGKLFDWQAQIVRWALRRGRAALFEDCGLGKTAHQLEWARLVSRHQDTDGINEGDVLRNFTEGRENDDEKHLCPLQLGVIERCVKLWSNPDDVVLSPFMGIGSEGYVAIRHNRRFIGCELKPSYFRVACANLRDAERQRLNVSDDLFGMDGAK